MEAQFLVLDLVINNHVDLNLETIIAVCSGVMQYTQTSN